MVLGLLKRKEEWWGKVLETKEEGVCLIRAWPILAGLGAQTVVKGRL